MTFNRHNNRAAKVTHTIVLEMRERYALGWSQGRLAREYHLSVGQVGRIVRGESWQQFSTIPAGSSGVIDEELQRRALAGGAPPTDEATLHAKMRAAHPELFLAKYPGRTPSLYDDPPPVIEGEATGQGFSKLQHELEALPLSVDSELDKLEKGDST